MITPCFVLPPLETLRSQTCASAADVRYRRTFRLCSPLNVVDVTVTVLDVLKGVLDSFVSYIVTTARGIVDNLSSPSHGQRRGKQGRHGAPTRWRRATPRPQDRPHPSVSVVDYFWAWKKGVFYATRHGHRTVAPHNDDEDNYRQTSWTIASSLQRFDNVALALTTTEPEFLRAFPSSRRRRHSCLICC